MKARTSWASRTIDPYENLANAIILRAVCDYRLALRRLKRDKDNSQALRTVAEIERFFCSELYRSLTNVDANFIIKKIRGELGL